MHPEAREIAMSRLTLVSVLLCTLLAFVWIRESPARLFRSVLSASRRPAGEEDQNVNPNLTVK